VLDLTKPSRATNGVSLSTSENGSKRTTYNIGKYDEDRSGMYETDLFQNSSYVIDGFTGKRVIHIGLDLGGPVGTPVYSFADGTVYKAGYNPSEGDYGNVVVTVHNIAGRDVYALYGHLDAGSVVDKKEGDNVKRGDLIGRLGAKNENGGWEPHVHFQISTLKPSTHDMPGVVSRESREKALVDYPDPRIVLGKLYKD
jgi:murein DD-endopeptidase MepM/ murein hydrolase activator NlpD